MSAIGGAIIAGFGLGQRNAATPFLLLLGGALIYRGVSGNCKLYEKLGIDTSAKPARPDEGPEGLVWDEVQEYVKKIGEKVRLPVLSPGFPPVRHPNIAGDANEGKRPSHDHTRAFVRSRP